MLDMNNKQAQNGLIDQSCDTFSSLSLNSVGLTSNKKSKAQIKTETTHTLLNSDQINSPKKSEMATTVLLPPIEMSLEEQRALGYMPLRDDFEREYKNDSESIISNLAVSNQQLVYLNRDTHHNPKIKQEKHESNGGHYEDDTFTEDLDDEESNDQVTELDEDQLDFDLKLNMIDMYRDCLKERDRFKKIAREYGLINNASAMINNYNKYVSGLSATLNLNEGFLLNGGRKRKNPTHSSINDKEMLELNEKLKKFAQFLSVSDYESLLENLRKQHQLYGKIQKLHYYRSELGMTSTKEIEKYTKERQERKMSKPKRYSYLQTLSKRVTRGCSRIHSPNKTLCNDDYDDIYDNEYSSSFSASPSKRPHLANYNILSNGSIGIVKGKRGRKPKSYYAQLALLQNAVNSLKEDENSTSSILSVGISNKNAMDDVLTDDNDTSESENSSETETPEEEQENQSEEEASSDFENSEQENEDSNMSSTVSDESTNVYELNSDLESNNDDQEDEDEDEDNYHQKVSGRLRSRLTSRSNSLNNNSSILNVSQKSNRQTKLTKNSGLSINELGEEDKEIKKPKIKQGRKPKTPYKKLLIKLKRPLKTKNGFTNHEDDNDNNCLFSDDCGGGDGDMKKKLKIINKKGQKSKNGLNTSRSERTCSMTGYNLLSENEKKVNNIYIR
jgi:hypothetical protein